MFTHVFIIHYSCSHYLVCYAPRLTISQIKDYIRVIHDKVTVLVDINELLSRILHANILSYNCI